MTRFLGKTLILAAVVVAFTPLSSGQIPDEFTNLKVFPADISKENLVNAMKGFAMGLGVRCSYCHEGEGNDLSKYNFAADTNKHKDVARQMLRMTMELNQKFISKISHDYPEDRVRCVTCHRGKDKPTIE